MGKRHAIPGSPCFCVLVIVLLLYCLGAVFGGGQLLAADDIGIEIDTVPVDGGDAPLMDNGRVMIPLRSVVEYLGGKINWYPEEQQIVGFRGARGFDLVIGSSRAYLNDGSIYFLDVPAKIIGSRTYVPLRFVSEAMGCQVEWDESARVARITTAKINIERELEALVLPVLLQVTTDKGAGSGFFYARDGVAITCADLLKDAAWIRVKTSEGVEYQAEKMVVDSVLGLAKLRVSRKPGEEFPVFRYFDDFTGVEVGEPVYAFGSPWAVGVAPQAGASLSGAAASSSLPVSKAYVAGKINAMREGHADGEGEPGGINTYGVSAVLTAENRGGPLVKENGALLGVNQYAETDGVVETYVIPAEYIFAMKNR